MAELKELKGTVRIEGMLVGFDPTNEKTYRNGKTKEKGKPYRSVSLLVKTAKNNVIYNLDLFGQVPDKKVKIYSNKDGNKQKVEIDFEDRHLMPEGFTCFGFGTTSITLEKDSEGKYRKHNYFDYDAVEKIKDSLKDGDWIWVDASFKVETYINNEGTERTNVKYKIENIGFLKAPLDFESENFKEVSSFEYEVVVVNTNVNKEKKKLFVGARLIDFFGNFSDMTFTVDATKYEDLATNIAQKTRFGDVIGIQGKCVNGTVLVEAPKAAFDWGGETPAGVGLMNKDKISEFQITKVTKFTPKVYKQEDFVKPEPFKFEQSSNALPWETPDNENPFA